MLLPLCAMRWCQLYAWAAMFCAAIAAVCCLIADFLRCFLFCFFFFMPFCLFTMLLPISFAFSFAMLISMLSPLSMPFDYDFLIAAPPSTRDIFFMMPLSAFVSDAAMRRHIFCQRCYMRRWGWCHAAFRCFFIFALPLMLLMPPLITLTPLFRYALLHFAAFISFVFWYFALMISLFLAWLMISSSPSLHTTMPIQRAMMIIFILITLHAFSWFRAHAFLTYFTLAAMMPCAFRFFRYFAPFRQLDWFRSLDFISPLRHWYRLPTCLRLFFALLIIFSFMLSMIFTFYFFFAFSSSFDASLAFSMILRCCFFAADWWRLFSLHDYA